MERNRHYIAAMPSSEATDLVLRLAVALRAEETERVNGLLRDARLEHDLALLRVRCAKKMARLLEIS